MGVRGTEAPGDFEAEPFDGVDRGGDDAQYGVIDLGIRRVGGGVLQGVVDDRGDRLDRTRLPRPAPGDSWETGASNSYLREAVEVWREFDWRATEQLINSYPHCVTDVDGQPIHFIHAESPHAGATPLLLAHTYPGSSVDYLDLIDRLTDPVAHGCRTEDAFHVVVPDAPGYERYGVHGFEKLRAAGLRRPGAHAVVPEGWPATTR